MQFIDQMDGCIPSPSLFRDAVANYKVEITSGLIVRFVNLDNAATTPPFQCVEEAVLDFMSGYGSVHRGAGAKSRVSTDAYEHARKQILSHVGAPPGSYLVFTGNTTGAMCAAAHYLSFIAGNIMVSSIEHSSSWLPFVVSEGRRTCEYSASDDAIFSAGSRRVHRYALDFRGDFDLAEIRRQLTHGQVKAVVVTASSNITGYIPDIRAIAAMAHAHGAYVVLDACQYIPHHHVDMVALGVDFLAASGHKFYAPYGGGFLVAPKMLLDSVVPYQMGGGNLPYISSDGDPMRQPTQAAHDPGTPNALGAITMAAALDKLASIGYASIEAQEHELTRMAWEGLRALPKIKTLVPSRHLNTVVPFVVDGVPSKEVARRLNDDFGIGIRAGSFCTYEYIRQVLGITDDSDIVAAVRAGDMSKVPAVCRASVGLQNSEEDVTRFLAAMKEIAS
jgi:cysteine desulfurase